MACAKGFNELKTIIQENYSFIKILSSEQVKKNTIDDIKQLAGETGDLSEEEISGLTNLFNNLYPNDKITSTQLLSWLGKVKIEETGEPKIDSPMDSEQDYEDSHQPRVNFIEDVYGGSSAKSSMLRLFNSEVIKSIIVDLDREVEILGDIESLNTNIQDLHERLYGKILKYIKKYKPDHLLPEKLYNDSSAEEALGLELLDKFFRAQTGEFSLFADFKVDVNTLSSWRRKAAVREEEFEDKLEAYNAYFILKNFDKLITNQYGSFINYLEHDAGKLLTKKDKYSFDYSEDTNKVTTWQQEDLQDKGAYNLIPKHLQRFIESCEIIDADGNRTNKFLTQNHITYFVSKIKKDFRTPKYNSKHLVQTANDNGTVLDIKNKLDFSSGNGYLKGKESQISETLKEQLALLLLDQEPDQLGRRILYLEDIVNNIRDHSEQTLKTLFDVRELIDQRFTNEIEERIFKNLYKYLFADRFSLYKSSQRIYGELATLFDTTSMVDQMQYKMDVDGNISVSTLSPEMIDQNLNVLKRRINSQFSTGNIDYLLKRYDVKINDIGEKKSVEFTVKDYFKNEWKFVFGAKEQQRWSMSRPSESDPTKREEYDPKVSKLTERDLSVLSGFIKDVLLIDIESDPELKTAVMAQYKNRDGSTNLHNTLQHLLDMAVNIFSNAAFFRRVDLAGIKFTPAEKLDTEKLYITKEYKEGKLVRNAIYTTADDNPIEYDELTKIFGTTSVWFKTKAEVEEMRKRGVEFGTEDVFSYKTIIENWLGDEDALRINSTYQSVDIISARQSKNLEAIAKAQALLDGSTFKSQVRTAERTNITIGQSSMLLAERFTRLGKYARAATHPMTVLWNNLKKAVTSCNLQREAATTAGVKQNKDFNFKENFYSCFVIDFLLPLYAHRDWKVKFTEAVNSDKPNVPKIIIDNKDKILTALAAKTQIKDVLGDVYRQCFNNIQKDFKDLTNFFNTNMKTEDQRDIKITLEHNFQEYNEWCKENNVSPVAMLAKIALEYNIRNRKNPIAIAENIHYHTNFKSGNLEINFSFLDALAKYTVLSEEEYNTKLESISNKIKETESLKEKKYLNDLRQQLINDYSNGWREKIKGIITSENTRAQLTKNGSDADFQTFKNQYLRTVINTNSEVIDLNRKPIVNNVTGEVFIPTTTEEFKYTAYDDFIDTSNVHFVQKLLKNDVSFDLLQLESKTQITKFTDGIVDQIPELQQEFSELMEKDPNNEKTYRNALKKKFTRKWFTPGWDRMAFGILQYETEPGVWKDLTSKFVEDVENISKTTEGWVDYPVQLSTYSDLALLHINSNGTRIDYTDPDFDLSSKDLYYTNSEGKEVKVRVKINPILEQYNLNSHYWTTLSTFATTGSHVWSDPKKAANTLQEECFKWFDNNKRNVINSATKLQFRLGDVWGITKMANVAVVDDIIAECTDILGDITTVKPYDGATFVNPFMHYWENYSLNNQITGFTKKPIHEFYDERLMAGGLHKTASFAITNNTMRNSQNFERMMWKMSNSIWSDENGRPLNVDLTLGLDLADNIQKENPDLIGNNCIGLTNVVYKVDGKPKEFRGPMYFENTRNGRMVREIVEFKSLGNNRYRISTKTINQADPVDEEGNTKYVKSEITRKDEIHRDVVTINNNYTFWKVLGGYNSAEFNTIHNKFEYSENSIKTVADWAAKVRFRYNNNGELVQQKYNQNNVGENAKAVDKLLSAFRDQIQGDKFSNAKDSYRDRDDRINYCPLKHSDIHYLVTRGATKKYAANINSKEAYMNDSPLNFFKIRMSEAGIQLDPTHEADQSVVSMMTQVISALAERGYTNEIAQEVYDALSELTSLAIADDMAAFEKYFFAGDRRQLQNVVSRLIVKEFMESKTSTRDANIARAITERLIAEGQRGQILGIKETQGIYPFSDPSMYNLLQTTITSAMNKKAIRAKMFGTLSVLNPSHELLKMFGNKMLSEFTSFREIQDLQNSLEKTEISLQQAEIGRTYKVIGGTYNGQLFTLHNSDYYYAWKNRLRGQNYKLVEQIYAYDLSISGDKKSIAERIKENNGQFNFYKFTTDKGEFIKRIGDVDDLQDNIKSAQKVILFGRNLAARNFFYKDSDGRIGNRYDLKPVQDARYVQIHDKVKEELSKLYEYNNLATISDALDSLKIQDRALRDLYRNVYIKVSNGQIPRLNRVEGQKEMQRNLLGIKNYDKVSIYDENNNERTLSVKSYKTKSFEAILPMVYAEQFGLRKGDTISDIITDMDFFTERILENYIQESEPDTKRYDICIKRANGKHIYIKYADETFENEGLERLNISKYTDENGTYRMDPRRTNKKIYPLSSNEDQVYYDRNSQEEVILTNNLEFYIKELKFTDINISKDISENTKKVLSEALQNNNKNIVCKSILNQINTLGYPKLIDNQIKFDEVVGKFVRNTGRYNKKVRETLLKELRELSPDFMDKIESLAKKQRVSFFQSLNFTVARIPAQGMQSFMAMEIVGFNDTGVNDCYVSAEQIRLQGSDYDVDKATFMGFAYDRTGQFVKWSPFFKMYTTTELEDSMKYLPYPNGRKAKKEKGENSIDFSKYSELFEVKPTENTSGYENEEESENDNLTDEAAEPQKIIYVLKRKRSQALLGELLRDVNRVARKQISDNIYTKEFTLYYDSETVQEELVDAIIQTANKHNNYINRVEKEEKENLLKNFVSYKTLSIAKNPANAVAGETTVDESAKPWKDLGATSTMGARPQDSRPGDSSILWSALQQNHTGKDVIAIAASAGLKCFHAITQVFNQALRNRTNLSDLWFNVDIEDPLTEDGKTSYHFVADPYLELDEYTNPNLTQEQLNELKNNFIDRLKQQGLSDTQANNILTTYLNHREWAGSNDSGILTLATDNAKELMLDRLNAGQDLAGLYLYGISIGMPGEDIFKIMTSPTAQVLARLTKDNIFTSEYLSENISNAIDNIRRINPRTPTEPQKYSAASVGISAEKTIELDKAFNALGLSIEGIKIERDQEKLKKVPDKIGLLMRYQTANGKFMSIRDSVIKASRDGDIDKYIKRLKLIKNRVQYNARQDKKHDNKTHTFGYSYNEVKAKEQMDDLIQYVININEIVQAHKKIDPEFKGNIWADLNNIATLNEGYRETAVLRGLLGLNQGAKTKTYDKYKFYEDFSMIIAKRLKKAKNLTDTDKESILQLLSKDQRIDLEKFMQDPKYQQDLVQAYDKIKHTYNPLRIVLSVPHFASYLRAAISDYNKTRGVSMKFRTMVDEIVPYIHNKMGIISSRETPTFYKKGEDFINNLIVNKFLIEQKAIIIPKGNKIFYKTTDSQGNEVLESKVYEFPVSIELGTMEGNETFRNWMNNEVIPRLHDLGESWAPDVSIGQRIKIHGTEAEGVNTFLKDLTPNITNQTFDHNNIKIFALPIDMIPKSDIERDKLARYTTDFIDLRNYKYAISSTEGYNLLDLFFYYNLINFRNSGGASSLTALFEPLVNETNSIISKYYTFVSNMDTIYTLTEGVDYTEEMLKKALAPTSREMSARKANSNKIEYFSNLNKDTLKYELYKRDEQLARNAQEEQQTIGHMGRNNYFIDPTFRGISISPTYHKVYQLKKGIISSIEIGNVIGQIHGEFENGLPKSLTISNISIKLPETSTSPNSTIPQPDVKISGKTLQKMLKVRNVQGTYEFNINPISLLIYLSSLREC